MTTQSKPTLLAAGASGQLGRRVVELLLEADTGPVIATTRTPAKLADLAAQGVDVRYADFDQPASLVTAFTGADRLLLISTDALDRRVAQHKAAIAAAEQAGVKHVLYTSFVRTTDADNPVLVAPDHRDTEAALVASTLDWTILRNNIYTEMLLMSLPQAVAFGQLISAGNGGKTAYVTREDCARAAAAALAANTTGRHILDITGPQALSDAEIAQIVGEVSNRPVQYVGISADEKRNILIGAGLPAVYADVMLSFEAASAQGFLNGVSTAVADLTGVAPQNIHSFLTDHRAALLAATN